MAEKEVKSKIRIKIKSYDNKIIDASCKTIIETALRYNAEIVGPIPLPTDIKNIQLIEQPLFIKILENNLKPGFIKDW